MNALIAVVVAFLSNGDMNYAAVDAADEADCKQKVLDIAQQRIEQSEQEEIKVIGFNFQCIEFENKFPVTTPDEPTPSKAKHIPGNNEA
jgi:hypothetical protein